jgi:UDP-N-acetylmuramate--alanine ligase
MNANGHTLSGSDRSDSELLRDLRSQGIEVSLQQDGTAVPKNADLFVYSEAIPATAPERMKAAEHGIRQISYFQALGELTKGKDLIAICGTHGKSSTTAMAAKVFIDAGLDPNVVIGTKMKELGGRNWRKGQGNLWIVEACEYRKSFHFLEPSLILVTNVDGDHFDAFKDIQEYENAFIDFFHRLPANGVVIGHSHDRPLIEQSKRAWIDADTQPLIDLGTPGVHMQHNAQLVLALAERKGIDESVVRASLKGYEGSWRRMELKGETQNGVPVIDDYGHHPLEIRATLLAIKQKYPKNRLVCVFQPHTHDRTLKMWKEFTQSFEAADMVIIPNVYDARPDRESATVDMTKFVSEIAKESTVVAIDGLGLGATKKLLTTSLKANDVLLIMGAGDITNLAGAMVQE